MMRMVLKAGVIFLIGAAAALAQHSGEAVPDNKLFYDGMKSGVAGYRIPALITAANGDLVAMMDERVENKGDLNRNHDINIVMRRSLDNGRTWLALETVVDYPWGRSASDASLILDRSTGELFCFYNYMDLDEAPGIYRLHVISSRDNGATWGQPRDITDELCPADWEKDFKFITSGRGFQNRSGILLHTLVNLQKGLHCFQSTDHGEHWALLEPPLKPGDESKIIELSDGSWMVNSRVNGGGFRTVHQSTDQGCTWHSRVDSSLADPGCNGSIIVCPVSVGAQRKNLLIFSNLDSDHDRKNLTIRISDDDGQSWTGGHVIYAGSAAYSSMTVLADGRIGILYERDNYTRNDFAVYTLAQLGWNVN